MRCYIHILMQCCSAQQQGKLMMGVMHIFLSCFIRRCNIPATTSSITVSADALLASIKHDMYDDAA